MDHHPAQMKTSSSYEQIQSFKILLHQLTAIGGKRFLDAAKDFFSDEGYQNSRKDDAMGDRLSSVDGKNDEHYANFNSNTVIHTLYSSQGRENVETPSTKNDSMQVYGPRKRKLWKPHYEAATKITEIRRNENANMRSNLPVESKVPFIAGTSISRSHNILLNCQHVMAQLKMAQTRQPNEGRDVILSHPEQELHHGSSAVIAKLPGSQLNDGLLQNFKGVLQHLYDEYNNLSREYDELVTAMSVKGINKKCVKGELKSLEQTLDRKEQEIMMLIILYREVINLSDKQKRASKEGIKSHKGKQNAVNLTSSTDLKLKFLLTQIQKFEKLLIKRN